jgi:4,5-dihydroxyphthalate decarboxylase
VIKDSVLQSQPELAQKLFSAFQAAKKTYLAHLAAGDNLSPADESAIALKQVVGDPFPFGISDRNGPNRKAIETLVQFATDQQVIPKKYSVEELFASETLNV